MTLADLLRKYLEDRRRACEEKAKHLESGSEFQYFSKQNEGGVDPEKDEDKKLFSNTLESTPVRRKPKTKLNDECTDCKTTSINTSRTVRSRMVTLPNGKIQVETIIKDGNGNEEKRVTYQEGDKVYTTITRRDASGNEKVEQKVEDATNSASDYNNSVVIFPDQFFGINNQRKSAESGYDVWFNRFFRPKSATPPAPDEMSPFDVGNLDDTLAQIMKMFDIDPFTGKPRNLSPSEQDPSNNGWFFDDFNKDINDMFRENRGGFKDKAEMDEPFLQPQPVPIKKVNPRKENVSQFANDISTPKTSLFTEFAERAIAKIPEEETPLDRFLEPDKRKKQKQLEILKETAQFMKVLKEYFENDRHKNSNDVVPYFTVQRRPQVKNQIVSFPSKSVADDRQISDLESLVAGYSGPPTTMKIRAGSTTEIRFPNGNTRTQKIVLDKDGNTETRITYRSGRNTYTVIKVTNSAGEVLQKLKKCNFREDQLNEFVQQWDKKYQSDFSE